MRAANPQGAPALIDPNAWRPENTAPVVQTMRSKVTFSMLEGLKVPTLLLTGDADLCRLRCSIIAARIKNWSR